MDAVTVVCILPLVALLLSVAGKLTAAMALALLGLVLMVAHYGGYL